jgi:hypothetical protein
MAMAVVLVGVLAYDRDAHEPFGPPKWAALGVGLTALVALECLRRSVSGDRVPAALCLAGYLPLSGFIAAWFGGWPGRCGDVLLLEGAVAVPAAFLAWATARHSVAIRRWLDLLGVCGVAAALVGLAQVEPASGSRGAFDAWGFPSTPDFARFGVLAPVAEALHGTLASLASPDAAARLSGPFSFIVGPLLEAVGPLRPFALLPRNDGPASVSPASERRGGVRHRVFHRDARRRVRPQCRRPGPLRWPRRVLGAVCRLAGAGIMAVYLVATGTRGPWVALLVVALCAVFVAVRRGARGVGSRSPRPPSGRLSSVLGAVLWIDSALPGNARGGGPREPLLTRVRLAFSGDDPRRDTVNERLVLRENSRAILRRPGTDAERVLFAAVGTGPSTWAHAYPDRQAAVARHAPGTYTLARRPDHAHQEALEWLVERGFLGAMLVSFSRRSLRPASRRRATGPDDRAWTAAAVATAALALIVVSSSRSRSRGRRACSCSGFSWARALRFLRRGRGRRHRRGFRGLLCGMFALLAKAPLAALPAVVAPRAVVAMRDAFAARRRSRALLCGLLGLAVPWVFAFLWMRGRPVEAASAATAPIAGLLVLAFSTGRVAFTGSWFRAAAFAACGALRGRRPRPRTRGRRRRGSTCRGSVGRARSRETPACARKRFRRRPPRSRRRRFEIPRTSPRASNECRRSPREACSTKPRSKGDAPARWTLVPETPASFARISCSLSVKNVAPRPWRMRVAPPPSFRTRPNRI